MTMVILTNGTVSDVSHNADKFSTGTMVVILLVIVAGFFAVFAVCAVSLNIRCVQQQFSQK